MLLLKPTTPLTPWSKRTPQSAERAKEKKKNNKELGIKPKRKAVDVEKHYDDLGDDLTGLGDDMTFLTADVTMSDWTDNEGDGEVNSLVFTLFGLKQMTVANVFELDTVILNLASSEPEILKLTARPDPRITTLEVRRHNSLGPPIDVSTKIDLTVQAQCQSLGRHLQQQPISILLLETLPHHAEYKERFNAACHHLTQVQENKRLAFVLTEHTQQVSPHIGVNSTIIMKHCQFPHDPTCFRIHTNSNRIGDKFENVSTDQLRSVHGNATPKGTHRSRRKSHSGFLNSSPTRRSTEQQYTTAS